MSAVLVLSLPIHLTQVAQPALAGWLQRLLEPALESCRFQRPVPLEIRPTGRWGGWCSSRESAPDGRVVLSSKICFWTAESIAATYLHEASHRLLSCMEVASHGPEFLCVNAILLTRARQSFLYDGLEKLGLYDLADCPPELEDEPGWRGQVLNFALAAAEELAATELAAEELAGMVCERWQGWLHRRQLGLNQQGLQARKAALADSLQKRVQELEASLFLWFWLARIAFVFSFLLGLVLLTERLF